MKNLIVVLLLSSVVCFSSCSSSETDVEKRNPANNTGSASPAADSANTDEETAEPERKSEDAKASREEIESKDAAQTGLGPTDTIRALNDAVIKKDAARIRSFLTRGSIKMVEESAKEQGKTVDQILTSDDGAPMPVEREMRNETIEGDTATVEVKNSVLGNFDKIYLVKEAGNWRVALDKFQDEMMRKLNEMQKDAPVSNR